MTPWKRAYLMLFSARLGLLLGVFLGLALLGCATESPRPDPTESVRPRIGQVVDAETGKPIDGAVILDAFYLAQALTDSEGRFTLSGPFDSLSWWTEGLYIFKPGYGPRRFRGQNEVAQAEGPQWSWLRQTWDRFTTSGVIELRPLRTREERLKYIDRAGRLVTCLKRASADRRLSGSTSLTFLSIACRTSNAQ
jgi:hypothetical protein